MKKQLISLKWLKLYKVTATFMPSNEDEKPYLIMAEWCFTPKRALYVWRWWDNHFSNCPDGWVSVSIHAPQWLPKWLHTYPHIYKDGYWVPNI